jgi:YfiH family protein
MQMQRYHWVHNSGRGFIQLPALNHSTAFHFFGTRLLSGAEMTDVGGAESSIRTRQIHGDRIHQVTDDLVTGPGASEGPLRFSQEIGEGDGLTTDRPGILINVSTADCVPVLLLDPVRKAVSALHAGWRGTVLNISAKAVELMRLHYGSDPADLLAGIGPSIGPCCYEVGNDVWEQIEKGYFYGGEVVLREENQKAMLDLVQLNRLQLIEAGIPSGHITFSGLCTSCLPSLFYSFRRDQKRLGTMTSGIMISSSHDSA